MASTKKAQGVTHVRFRVNYITRPGDNVCLVGSGPLGEWKLVHHMNFRGVASGDWEFTTEVPLSQSAPIEYKYQVVQGDGNPVWEGGANRKLNTIDLDQELFVELRDTWRPPTSAEATYLDTSLFREVVFRRDNKAAPLKPLNKVSVPQGKTLVRFSVTCTIVSPESQVFLAGSSAALGSWDATKAVLLSDGDYPFWKSDVIIPDDELDFHYKYVIVNKETGKQEWEYGLNRVFSADSALPPKDAVHSHKFIFDDGEFRLTSGWRGAGTAMPVFSLRTRKGLGVGEFLDLKLLADWSVKCGLNMIQILPINDTTVFKDYRDSYPYSAVSVFALHPMYIRIDEITQDKDILKEVDEKRTKLNALKQIDFVEVMKVKTDLLHRIFEKGSANLHTDKNLQAFIQENKKWLAPYALFCNYRDEYGTSDFSKWQNHASITQEQIDKLTDSQSPLYKVVLYNYWVQWHLHKQLLDASEYIKSCRVGLKGDLPIGVNRQSVDTWVYPHLFRMNMSTGAPPDAFSDDGQNWGFPTYNWDVMAQDGYAWWRARLGQMANYFHAFRIDHILGFFRIWEIPFTCVTGLLGRFNPALPVWKGELADKGIWDMDRLCEPYIRWHLLEGLFGDKAGYVAHTFLQHDDKLTFKFKSEWNSEKKIRDGLSTEDNYLLSGLFKLIQNVVLLREEGDDQKFHPRIEMQKTSSFGELDNSFKHSLHTLYISYFYERQEDLWRVVGSKRLPVIRSCTKMLVCGEDLGMVPKCVTPVLDQIGILGLRIQRMPSDVKIEFYQPTDYSYLTVCTTSSHDMSTLRGWWEEDRVRSQRFYHNILGYQGSAPFFCESYVSQGVLSQHFFSPSMWAILPIQDLMGISPTLSSVDPREQKINEPSNPTHYWRYRLHVYMEDLLENQEFNDKLKNLIQTAGRRLDL